MQICLYKNTYAINLVKILFMQKKRKKEVNKSPNIN